MFKRYILLIILLFCHNSSYAIDRFEQKASNLMHQYVQNEGLDFLLKTVNINSGTNNIEGVKANYALYDLKLKEIGFETRWVDLQKVNRSGHLIAEYKGKNAKKTILMIGHLDTVHKAESKFQSYNYRNSNEIQGPGILDMKVGNMLIVYLVKTLKDLNILDDYHIKIFLCGDEEAVGLDKNNSTDFARSSLIDLAKNTDYVLAFESINGMPKNNLTTARRGVAGFSIEIKTNSGHSSKLLQKDYGIGAAFLISNIMNKIYTDILPKYDKFSFSPGALLSGLEIEKDQIKPNKFQVKSTGNVIPPNSYANGTIRYVNEEQLMHFENDVIQILNSYNDELKSKFNTGFTHDFNVIKGYPPMEETSNNLRLLELMNEVSFDLKLGEIKATDIVKKGAGDVSFVAKYAKASIDSLGGSGYGEHTDEETLYLNELNDIAKRDILFLIRLRNFEL